MLTHAQSLCATVTGSADMTKKGSPGSCYNDIHHDHMILSLQTMTRVQPPPSLSIVHRCRIGVAMLWKRMSKMGGEPDDESRDEVSTFISMCEDTLS